MTKRYTETAYRNQTTNTFETYRRKLTGLAYRITGSRFEADDIVQDAYLKWQAEDIKKIKSPFSWLMTIVTRLALDQLRSARVTRETYIGPWLPEPYIEENELPDQQRELDESITMALMVLMEQLTPTERASFILHDLFKFEFFEIGEILDKSDTACRKLASRARNKVKINKTNIAYNEEEHLDIINAFMNAIKQGDLNGLVKLLQDNVVFHSDGGGKAIAAGELIIGLNAVTDFMLGVISADFKRDPASTVTITENWFNGVPGLVVWENNNPVTAFNFEITDKKINKIHALRNPDKLKLFQNKTIPE